MRVWLATLLLVLGLCETAQAQNYLLNSAVPTRLQERILDFDSDIEVQQNGDMDVTETIEVQAAGRQIAHGLLRDFPTTYRRPDGTRVKVAFDVRSVTRDGAPEHYTLERLADGVRIRIGSANAMLAPGPHRFAIRYTTSRQIGFFHDFDELYWNVTGNGWTFPIDHATASIHLPQAVPILQSSLYTGPRGAHGKNARVASQGDGRITFETTAPLAVNEGLTIAAAWRKGVVTPPSQSQIAWRRLRDNLDLVAGVLGFLLLAAYYAAVFMKTRRRTPRQVVPLYEPPDGMSAPAVQFLLDKRHGTQALPLAIMEMIALRAMRIDKNKGEPKFRRLEETTRSRHGLERDGMLPAMLEKLFRTNQSFSNGRNSGKRFDDARTLMESTIDLRFKQLIDPHRPLVRRGFLGWLVFLAACIGAAWAVDPESGKNTAFIAPFLAVPVAALTYLYDGLRHRSISWGVALFGMVFVLPFLIIGVDMLIVAAGTSALRALPAVLPALMLPVVIRASLFARTHTPAGEQVMDKIAGFRQYLTLAEGPRLEALASTDEKLQVYERYLPYAIALGVGGKWAAAFAGLAGTIAGMAAVQAMQQHYGGHDLLSSDPSAGLRGVSDDIASGSSGSASSSSGPSGGGSSSSGSSGGGSSGGGGGGGGGSGW